MAIRMHFLRMIFAESAAAIIGDEQGEAEHVNALIVRRIDLDFAEVERTRIDVAHPRPFLAAIFGAENATGATVDIANVARAAFITLHHRHHHLGIARGNGEADPAGLPGKSAGQFFPGSAAVRALEDAADIFSVGRDTP